MMPQELQKLIDEKNFAKIAVNLLKLTRNAEFLEDIEKILSIYDEVPKLSNWTKKGSGYNGFPTARAYLAVNIASLRDYDCLCSKYKELGLEFNMTKSDVRKKYLNAIRLIFD